MMDENAENVDRLEVAGCSTEPFAKHAGLKNE